jgi:hypothetical protein
VSLFIHIVISSESNSFFNIATQGPVHSSENSIITKIIKAVFGGDGAITASVAKSCQAAYEFYNVSDGKVYVNQQIDPNGAVQVQCAHGTSLGGDGSIPSRVSQSCQTAFDFFGVNESPAFVHTDLNSAMSQRVFCENGTSLGGDGTTLENVAASCVVAFRLNNVSIAKAYIDPELNATQAVQVQCINGTSLGGNGMTVQNSSASCAALWTHWGRTNGTFYVNSSQTFVILCSLRSNSIPVNFISQDLLFNMPRHRFFKFFLSIRCLQPPHSRCQVPHMVRDDQRKGLGSPASR